MDIIDRVCWHGYVYCPRGCHDILNGRYAPPNAGVTLWLELLEQYANGTLPDFDAELNLGTMLDGVDEACALGYNLLRDERN